MPYPKWPLAGALLASLLACSPTYDWREFDPDGAGLRLSFPCRPDRHARNVLAGGAKMQIEMLVCSAGDATFAVAFARLSDPAAVATTLGEWRAAALANLGGATATPLPLQLWGATPNAQAAMLVLSGRRPDGSAVLQQAAFFAKGLQVYQASVIGSELPAEATQTFFAGLKVLP
jgi:hypothetical protein